MADLMTVAKLEKDEVVAVRKMAMMWLEDGNIKEHSGWSPKTIARAIENLPYVEPDHQPMVEDMVTFFYDFEDIFSDRVIESLQRVFG